MTGPAWFGYERVTPDEKSRRVRGVFDSVAGKYDLMNDLMSAGLHRGWKRFAVEIAGIRPGARVLDLAGGTGDIALLLRDRVLRRDQDGQVQGSIVLGDINGEMLKVGRDRMIDRGVVAGPLSRRAIDQLSTMAFAR